ncbi:MAG: acyl-CoA thioesterase domain-containing protein [Actinomycetota bacterium]
MVTRPATFAEILEMESHGPDTWVGLSPSYTWGRVYGGQVVAQALWAALQTVDEHFLPHSLHAYFIRGGVVDEPIRYEVDRLRNGRSFCTRSVVARQSSGAILHLSSSFQVDETNVEAEIQTVKMPLAPEPDDMRKRDDDWPFIMARRTMVSHPGAGKSMGWVQLTDPLGDNPLQHVCGLAFTSDTIQFGSARSAHPLHVPEAKHRETFIGASLDHAMWFHRPIRADEWHLYEWECRTMRGGRGATFGNLFAQDGTHVASIAQEVLLRERREIP